MKKYRLLRLILPTLTRAAIPTCLVSELGSDDKNFHTASALPKVSVRATRSFVVAALCATLVVCSHAQAYQQNQIHIDLPANGQLRIENQFGDIGVSVGQQREVLISIEVEGTPSTSPVVIETKQNLLTVTVARQRESRVNLVVTLPEKTRAEIVTRDGTITTHGLPVSLSLHTVTGSVHTEVESSPNIDVIAMSTSGVVRSDLTEQGSDPRAYRARLGQGQKILRITTQRGDVAINTAAANSTPAPPELKTEPGATRGAGTPATNSAIEEVDEGDVVRVDAQLVSLNLSVVDRGTNKGLMGLNQSDFKLFENGVEQRLLQFDSASAPFDLILLIDLSGSTRDVVKLIRGAARRFVDAARPSDRIAIITFAGKPTVVAPLTLDREELRQRVNTIDTVPGDTKLYDAGDFAIAEAAKQTKNSRRAAVVIMSDGLDGSIEGVQGDGSKLPYKEFLNNVREFDGVVYTLWLDTYYEAMNAQDTQPEAFDTGYDRMKELADAGGGLFYEVNSLDDLAGAYEHVVADLGTVYGLAYRPTDKTRDGKWRAIKVTVNRNNAIARGKHGYYAN